MVSFRRTLFGYRRVEVEAAINARDAQIAGLEQSTAALSEHQATLESRNLAQAHAIASHEADVAALSAMVVERERTIRDLTGRLEEANACHDRSIASLDAVSARLEDLQAQARGQATRIRMKALREAVALTQRVDDVQAAEAAATPGAPAADHAAAGPGPAAAPDSRASGSSSISDIAAEAAAVDGAAPTPQALGNGAAPAEPDTSWTPGLYEGKVRLEIGPLGDFSQLVGFEEAVGSLGATDISVERFSEGRATFSMRLDRPTDLLRELESASALDFRVRHTAPGDLILDVDED